MSGSFLGIFLRVRREREISLVMIQNHGSSILFEKGIL